MVALDMPSKKNENGTPRLAVINEKSARSRPTGIAVLEVDEKKEINNTWFICNISNLSGSVAIDSTIRESVTTVRR